MSDTYTVERSTTIGAPASSVYEQIADFHNWPAWSPWEELDPNMDKTYSGTESGTGAEYSWSGNRQAGQGSMKINEAVDSSKVEISLEFLKPFKSSSITSFDLQPEGDGTKVTWTMVGPNTLMLRVMGIFRSMDKMIGPDFEKGLAKLKQVAEG